MLRVSLAAFLLSASMVLLGPSTATADSNNNKPGWVPVVVARGEFKQWIDSTPIVDRPNRPLHFYGNTVRRRYYRGNTAPQGNDTAKGAAPAVQGKSS